MFHAALHICNKCRSSITIVYIKKHADEISRKQTLSPPGPATYIMQEAVWWEQSPLIWSCQKHIVVVAAYFYGESLLIALVVHVMPPKQRNLLTQCGPVFMHDCHFSAAD